MSCLAASYMENETMLQIKWMRIDVTVMYFCINSQSVWIVNKRPVHTHF